MKPGELTREDEAIIFERYVRGPGATRMISAERREFSFARSAMEEPPTKASSSVAYLVALDICRKDRTP